MAYVPINLAVLQYAVPSPSSTDDGGYGVLKAYDAGTTTVRQLATDSGGGTLVNSIQLDSSGFPTYGGSVIMPHVDDASNYKLALYANQDAADADTPSLYSHDSLIPISQSGSASVDDTTNNGVTTISTFTHTTSNSPAAGIGSAIGLAAETAADNNETGVVLAGVTTDVTAGQEDFDFSVRLMIAGAAATEVAKFTSGGDLVFALSNPALLGNDADGALSVSPSTTADLGGNAVFYGQSHSTKAGDIELRNTTDVKFTYDHSATQFWMAHPLLIAESAAATADKAGYGQFWIKNDVPNTAWFTDDAGTDFQVATLAGTETLSSKTIDLDSNTITGTAAEFDTALQSDTFVFTSEVGSVVQAYNATLADIASNLTSTVAELNILDGVTATTGELNYLDVTAVGAMEASKALTADANGQITLLGTRETVNAISDGASVSLDPANGNWQTWTLGANRTPSWGGANGEGMVLLIDDGTAYTITWTDSSFNGGSGPTWLNNGGSAPTLATAGYTAVYLFEIGGVEYGLMLGDQS